MSELALDSPLGDIRASRLPAPGWAAALLLAAGTHAIAAAIYFSEPLADEAPVIPSPADDEIGIMLAPPAPPAAEAAAPPPPPPPPPDIELPDPPAEEPAVLAERADDAPPPMEITARRFAEPDAEPVRRASAVSQGREGSSGDPRFTAAQYPIFQAYLREVRLTYMSALSYPRAAERQRLQGRGVLRVRVTRDGRVEDWVLHQPIGHALLDREIERVARRTCRLPSLPAGLPYETFLIDVPITYRIVMVD